MEELTVDVWVTLEAGCSFEQYCKSRPTGTYLVKMINNVEILDQKLVIQYYIMETPIMIFFKRLIIFVILFFPALFSTAQTVSFVQPFLAANGTNGGNAQIVDVCSDDEGNQFVCGTFRGDMTVGSFTLHDGINSIFVLKLDPEGNCIWGIKENSYNNGVRSIAIDEDHNVYLTGTCSFHFNLDTFHLYPVENDAYIFKCSPNGEVLWLKHIESDKGTIGANLFYKNHSIFWSGSCEDSASFDNYDLQAGSFLAKLNKNGEPIWMKPTGDEGKIFVDKQNNIYQVGAFVDTAKFDSIVLTAHGFIDGFLAKSDVKPASCRSCG